MKTYTINCAALVAKFNPLDNYLNATRLEMSPKSPFSLPMRW